MTITTIVPLLTEPVADDLDTATFAARARVNFLEVNPILTAINILVAELNAEAAALSTSGAASAASASASASSASASAAAAAVSAAAAAATSTAANWVSGTTYAAGNVRRSLIDGLPYRRLTAGAGTTDPRDDKANWALDFFEYDTGLPAIRPTLLLDFANSGAVDPRITVTRAGQASYWDAQGVLRWAPANTLRITHDPMTGERLGALIEWAATNLVTYSEDLTAGTWGKFGASISANSAVSKDGSATADKIVETATTDTHGISRGYAPVTASTLYCFSAFVKASERNFALMGLSGGGVEADPWISVNLANGVCQVVNGSGFAFGSEACGDGWFRIWLTTTAVTSADVSTGLRTSVDGVWSNRIYAGDGVSGIHAWGLQLETGVTRPTSYIKTEAAAVTRAADAVEMTGTNFSSWYNPAGGSVLAEASAMATVMENLGLVSFEDGTVSNRVQIRKNSHSLDISFVGVSSGVLYLNNSGSRPWPNAGFIRVAFAFTGGDYIAYTGGQFNFNLGQPNLPTVNKLVIGGGANVARLNGIVRRLSYYPRRLSNDQLRALSR